MTRRLRRNRALEEANKEVIRLRAAIREHAAFLRSMPSRWEFVADSLEDLLDGPPVAEGRME